MSVVESLELLLFVVHMKAQERLGLKLELSTVVGFLTENRKVGKWIFEKRLFLLI